MAGSWKENVKEHFVTGEKLRSIPAFGSKVDLFLPQNSSNAPIHVPCYIMQCFVSVCVCSVESNRRLGVLSGVELAVVDFLLFNSAGREDDVTESLKIY